MIKLISLEFKNIGRFTEMQKIDFSSKGKMIQIDAIRKDYGGSSGSGKSTIIHVNDLLLGINSKPISVLQSRKTKDGYYAKGVYGCGANGDCLVTIERSKKDGLVITGTNPATGEPVSISGNNKLAEEFIDQIIEIPREIFKKMVHKEQKEGGFVLNMTPSVMFKFLAKVLGLYEWLEKLGKVDEMVSEKSKVVKSLESAFESDKAYLEQVQKTYTESLELVEPVAPVVNFDENKFNSLNETLSQLKERKADEIKGIQMPQKDTPQLDLSDLLSQKSMLESELRGIKNKYSESVYDKKTKISELNRSIQDSGRIALEKDRLRGEILKIKQALDHINKNSCPTCSQAWLDDGLSKKKASLTAEAQELASKLKALSPPIDTEAAKLEIADLNLAILNIEKTIQDEEDAVRKSIGYVEADIEHKKERFKDVLNKAEEDYKAKVSDYRQRVEKISLSFDKEIDHAQKEMAALFVQKESMTREINTYKQQLDFVNRQKASAEKAFNQVKSDFIKKEERLNTERYQLLLATESQRLIKSFLFTEFDTALDHIGRTATEYLSHVPNASTCTVYFEPFKENKGKVTEEVTCFISIDGDEGVPVKSLSGGERTSIDLAVDFAVADFIQQQTGIGADFIFLDEPFEGLETASRLEYVELLKTISANRRVIIVEHTDQVKEAVEDTITVHRDTDSSYIK